MKPEFFKFTFWTAVAVGMVCIIVLATLTFQSLFRLFGTQPENEKAIPAAAENASPGQNVQSVSDVGERPSVNPAPANNEFCTDSEIIRQQEKERHESTDNYRRQSADNQNSNTVILE